MICVQSEPFDTGAEIENILAGRTDIGAVVTFTGAVRGGPQDGEPLLALHIEHYPGMTERKLEAMEAEARKRWPLQDCLIIHRVGKLKPGETIVAVVTASAHRQAAFDAARFLMDFLKSRAPFWKREVRASGASWVEARADDETALSAWAL